MGKPTGAEVSDYAGRCGRDVLSGGVDSRERESGAVMRSSREPECRGQLRAELCGRQLVIGPRRCWHRPQDKSRAYDTQSGADDGLQGFVEGKGWAT